MLHPDTRAAFSRPLGRSLTAATVTALLVILAACGRSPNVAGDGSAAGAARWSTLGTRAATASASSPISGNTDGQWTDYNPDATYPNLNTTQRTITMPDGTELSAAVTLPADASGVSVSTPLPTILVLDGYDKNMPGNSNINSYAVQHGYAQVVVDVRGTGGSQGQWEAFGATEQGDDLPILDWVTAQPFCDGNIGLYGESLLGITAALAAARQHPAVKAAYLIVPMADSYRDIVFPGGQAAVGFIPLWLALVTGSSMLNTETITDPATGIPLQLTQLINAFTNFQLPLLLKAILGDADTVYDNDFWAVRSPIEQARNIHVPTFIVGGLHDIFQRGEPLLYETIKRNAPAKLLIGPWMHITTGSGLPADGVPSLNHSMLQWFDKYLRGKNNGAERLPNVTQYVLGLDHYVTATDWPHPQASAQRLYLRGDKRLSEAAPGEGEASNVTLQQPLDGVCSASAAQWTAGALGYLPLPCITDDSTAEALDVKYDSAALPQDLYLNGPIAVKVWVSTTAGDAGIAVRVDDVNGDTVTPLSNGLLTLSLRAEDDSRSRTLDGQLIQPWHTFTQTTVQSVQSGEPTEATVEVLPTSALIKAGHKLRISIGPSDFPHGLPPLPDLASGAIGALTIYSDAQHVSSVVLPVVPASVLN